MCREIAARFAVNGRVAYCERYGNGHINETYLVETDGGARYILGSKTPGQAATYKGSDCMSELTDNERIDVAATRVLVKYKAAFEELAK